MKESNAFTAWIRARQERINKNRQEIFSTNAVMFRKSVFFAICLFLGLFIISLTVPSFKDWQEVYGILFAIFIVLYVLLIQRKIVAFKILPTFGLYLISEIGFLFAIYLSATASPEQRATIILALFCLDTSLRINLFVAFNCVLHTVLVFLYKAPSLAFDDTVNCVAVMVMGIFVGENIRSLKLRHFDLSKVNAQMAEMDFLTGLYNRRKMYEFLLNDSGKSTDRQFKGAFMLDIDYFKGFNDSYGHSAGDECLRTIGKLLCEFGKQHDVTFFRFGGEEFTGFECTGDHDRLQVLAEKIKTAVLDANIPYPASEFKVVSVSIGYCSMFSLESRQSEQLIEAADKALYRAKGSGRNRCEGYMP